MSWTGWWPSSLLACLTNEETESQRAWKTLRAITEPKSELKQLGPGPNSKTCASSLLGEMKTVTVPNEMSQQLRDTCRQQTDRQTWYIPTTKRYWINFFPRDGSVHPRENELV